MIEQIVKKFHFEGSCYGDQIWIFTSCYGENVDFLITIRNIFGFNILFNTINLY